MHQSPVISTYSHNSHRGRLFSWLTKRAPRHSLPRPPASAAGVAGVGGLVGQGGVGGSGRGCEVLDGTALLHCIAMQGSHATTLIPFIINMDRPTAIIGESRLMPRFTALLTITIPNFTASTQLNTSHQTQLLPSARMQNIIYLACWHQ